MEINDNDTSAKLKKGKRNEIFEKLRIKHQKRSQRKYYHW